MRKELDYNESFAELCEKNIVLVPFDDVSDFWTYCMERNVCPSGGAFDLDQMGQYLYIED